MPLYVLYRAGAKPVLTDEFTPISALLILVDVKLCFIPMVVEILISFVIVLTPLLMKKMLYKRLVEVKVVPESTICLSRKNMVHSSEGYDNGIGS